MGIINFSGYYLSMHKKHKFRCLNFGADSHLEEIQSASMER